MLSGGCGWKRGTDVSYSWGLSVTARFRVAIETVSCITVTATSLISDFSNVTKAVWLLGDKYILSFLASAFVSGNTLHLHVHANVHVYTQRLCPFPWELRISRCSRWRQGFPFTINNLSNSGGFPTFEDNAQGDTWIKNVENLSILSTLSVSSPPIKAKANADLRFPSVCPWHFKFEFKWKTNLMYSNEDIRWLSSQGKTLARVISWRWVCGIINRTNRHRNNGFPPC